MDLNRGFEELGPRRVGRVNLIGTHCVRKTTKWTVPFKVVSAHYVSYARRDTCTQRETKSKINRSMSRVASVPFSVHAKLVVRGALKRWFETQDD